jgi:hypothetical protein
MYFILKRSGNRLDRNHFRKTSSFEMGGLAKQVAGGLLRQFSARKIRNLSAESRRHTFLFLRLFRLLVPSASDLAKKRPRHYPCNPFIQSVGLPRRFLLAVSLPARSHPRWFPPRAPTTLLVLPEKAHAPLSTPPNHRPASRRPIETQTLFDALSTSDALRLPIACHRRGSRSRWEIFRAASFAAFSSGIARYVAFAVFSVMLQVTLLLVVPLCTAPNFRGSALAPRLSNATPMPRWIPADTCVSDTSAAVPCAGSGAAQYRRQCPMSQPQP